MPGEFQGRNETVKHNTKYLCFCGEFIIGTYAGDTTPAKVRNHEESGNHKSFESGVEEGRCRVKGVLLFFYLFSLLFIPTPKMLTYFYVYDSRVRACRSGPFASRT